MGFSGQFGGFNNAGSSLGGKEAGANFREKRPHGYNIGSLQQFNPEQMELFQQLFGHVGPESFLSRLAGGDQSQFEQMEAPAMRQFQELQGQLGSRFSSMGMGARRGSGFQNAANQATSDFAMQLQSQRQGLQRQALMDLMGMSQSLLGQRPFERFLVPKQRNNTAELIGKLGGAIPGLISSAMGGGSPESALKGAGSIFGGGGGGWGGGSAITPDQIASIYGG